MQSTETLVNDYRMMLLIRIFEERLDALFATGAIGGTSHLCAGQEAVAVGAMAALAPDDMVTSNHRGHGHFLAKGGDPRLIMAELYGKATGYSGGRGGSQHMADFSIGFLGSNGITGGMVPVATGAALAQKLQGTGNVVACFFGDGATGQGAFHEGVNMGAAWDLPVIYVCENNFYAMSTPITESFRVPEVALRADAYGIPGVTVDGNDYFAVRAAMELAVARARAGEGPTLVEAQTYRIFGHSKSDKCEYRPDEEEAAWAARDPLCLMAERLLRDCGVTPEQADALYAEVAAEMDEAVQFAKESPDPDPATVAEGLWATAW